MSDMLENMTLNQKSTKLNLVVFCFILEFCSYYEVVFVLYSTMILRNHPSILLAGIETSFLSPATSSSSSGGNTMAFDPYMILELDQNWRQEF